MAYVLGFFAADGYVTVNKRGGQFWCIQITDKKLLVHIRKTIASDHKISTRPKYGNDRTVYRLQIGSIEMCDDLRLLGFAERKTKSLAVPNVPERYLASFVRGYFDGDGNVWLGYLHKERKVPMLTLQTAFTSGSRDFLSTLQLRLRGAGVLGGSLVRPKENYHRLQYGLHDSLKLYDFMYNHSVHVEISLLLARKKKIFEKYKEMRS